MKALTIFRKELREAVRDVRTFISSIAYALAGPALLMIIVNALALSMRDDVLSPVQLCGSGEAPALITHLEASGIVFHDGADICLSLPQDYAQRVMSGRTVRLEITADLTAEATTVARLEREIRVFSANLASQRLMARGVAPDIVQPIAIGVHNTSAVSRQALFSKLILVILFTSAPFFVSFAMAADITAGERERRSLEPLLAQPISPVELIAGKFLALSAVCIFGTTISILGGLALLEHSSVAELGLRIDTSPAAGLKAMLLLTPFCLLASAVQLAIGLWAKNFKEAQTYLMFLSFLPSVLGMVLTGERLAAASAWPLAWELGALTQPLLGTGMSAGPGFLLMAVLECALAAGLLLISALRVRSERILEHG